MADHLMLKADQGYRHGLCRSWRRWRRQPRLGRWRFLPMKSRHGLDYGVNWQATGEQQQQATKKGIQYYNNLINELLAKGLKPYVTIFHWDLPQSLQDDYNGFLSRRVVNDLRDFAELCFKEFGDRVKHWITLNEPYIFTAFSYGNGLFPPGRCSAWQNLNCLGGDSSTEPYIVAHNLLLAHGAVVKLYKDKYQASQKGLMGVTLVSHWFVPYSEAKHNNNWRKIMNSGVYRRSI